MPKQKIDNLFGDLSDFLPPIIVGAKKFVKTVAEGKYIASFEEREFSCAVKGAIKDNTYMIIHYWNEASERLGFSFSEVPADNTPLFDDYIKDLLEDIEKNRGSDGAYNAVIIDLNGNVFKFDYQKVMTVEVSNITRKPYFS